VINSLNQLQQFFNNLSKCLKGDEIILLKGNLGAGKTASVKALVKALGGDENEVSSPTFTLMNEYDTKKGTVYHLDLYRLDFFDITDIVGNGIVAVEWPKEDYTQYDFPVIEIEIILLDENKREIIVKPVYKSDYILSCF